MTKEPVNSARDVTAGQPLEKVVHREEGYFYFVTKDGTIQRAKQATTRLTDAQRELRAIRATDHKYTVQARALERVRKREQRDEAERAASEARRASRQATLDAKIAALQARKARV